MSRLPNIVEQREVTEERVSKFLRSTDKTVINHGDTDMNRSEKQQIADSYYGLFGEFMFYQMIEDTDDLYITAADTVDYDFNINGFEIELKTRKAWKYDGKTDLLVRKKPTEIAADVYVLAEFTGTSINVEEFEKADIGRNVLSNLQSFEIIGYIFADNISEKSEIFDPTQKSNDTCLVKRSTLGPFHKLHAELK